MRYILCFFLLWLSTILPAQVFMRPFDNAAALSLGGAVTAYPGIGVGLANDASAGMGEKLGFFLGSALPYSIGGWQTAYFQGVMRLSQNDGFGLEFLSSGIETYGEQSFRLLYGRRLSEKFLLGGSANILRVSAQEYGNATAATFGLSVLANPIPNVWLGARVQNPLQLELADESMPVVLRIGAAWKASNTFILLTEVEKDIDRKAQVKAGIEYRPVSVLVLRLGFRGDPARLGFGGGLQLKSGFSIETGFEWHPTLGLTPAAMLVWRKPAKK